MKRSFPFVMFGSLLAAGLALSLSYFGLIYYWAARHTERRAEAASNCQEIQDELAQTVSLLAKANTGMGSYLRTGKTRYLRPYHEAIEKFSVVRVLLEDLTRDDPAQQKRVKILIQDTVAPLDQIGSFATRDSAEQRRVDRASKSLALIVAQELSFLKEYKDKNARAVRETNYMAVAAGVFATFVFFAIFSLLKREIELRGKAEELVQNQADLLESVFENIGEGVVAADESGRFTVFNPVAQRMLGPGPISGYPNQWAQNHGIYSPDQVTLAKPEDLPMFRALRGEPTDNIEFFIKNPDNPDGISVIVTGRPLIDKEGHRSGGVVVLVDITNRKRAQERIEELNRNLRRLAIKLTQSNKELEAFSYSVAHDLRAPLRAIDGFGQFLLEDYSERLDEQGKDYLNRIRLGCRRMGQLIDDLLALANIMRHEVKVEAMDIGAIAASVIERIKETEPGRPIEFLSPPHLSAVGDPGLSRVALENLIGNAVKFTGKTEHPRIEFGLEKKEGESVYFIKDNGAGFDMRYADKMFDAFQRLHPQSEFPGSGIGLAIVHRIIERQGGRIWAEGSVGKGATFYFTLGDGGHPHDNKGRNHTSS